VVAPDKTLSIRRRVGLAVAISLLAWLLLEGLALLILTEAPPSSDGDLVAAGDDWLPNVKGAIQDSFFLRDPHVLWVQNPGYSRPADPEGMWGDEELRINALGLRSPPMDKEKPPGVRRVLVLGGSQPFGMGVGNSETYAAALQRLLDERQPAGWQVLNAAVPGHSTFQMRQYLEHYGLDLAPDIVLFDGGTNDDLALEPAYAFPDHEVQGNAPWTRELSGGASRSAVYRLLRQLLAPVVAATSDERVRVPADKRAENIAAMQRWGDERRFEIYFLSQVYVGTGDDDVPPLTPRPAHCLYRFEQYTPVVDVCGLFMAMGEKAGTYFTDVIHTSPPGHDLIAAAVLQTMLDEGALD